MSFYNYLFLLFFVSSIIHMIWKVSIIMRFAWHGVPSRHSSSMVEIYHPRAEFPTVSLQTRYVTFVAKDKERKEHANKFFMWSLFYIEFTWSSGSETRWNRQVAVKFKRNVSRIWLDFLDEYRREQGCQIFLPKGYTCWTKRNH